MQRIKCLGFILKFPKAMFALGTMLIGLQTHANCTNPELCGKLEKIQMATPELKDRVDGYWMLNWSGCRDSRRVIDSQPNRRLHFSSDSGILKSEAQYGACWAFNGFSYQIEDSRIATVKNGATYTCYVDGFGKTADFSFDGFQIGTEIRNGEEKLLLNFKRSTTCKDEGGYEYEYVRVPNS